MGPPVETVTDDTTLPDEVDVVVVGGGIIGVSTALYLSDKGLRVAVCEKGYIAGEQSSRNWGWVRVTHRDMREFELSMESLKLWRTLDQRLGIDTGFKQCGILYMANDDAKMEGHRVWLEKARALAGKDAFDTREVDPKTVAGLLPGATKAFKGGLYTPGDGRAEPQKAAPAIANALRKRGARCGNKCGTRQRGGDRARNNPLQERRGRGRRVVAALLRESGYQRAAVDGEGFSVADIAYGRRSLGERQQQGVLVPQAHGRRLYDRIRLSYLLGYHA